MNITEFQQWVENGWTAGRNGGNDLAIMALGLAGEAGEVIEPIKKELRGDGPACVHNLALELGDVQHYLCRIAAHYKIPMQDIIDMNVAKIEARRGKRAFETKEAASEQSQG